MYNRPFRNSYTVEASCTGQVTYTLPWTAGQVTLSNDHASGRTLEFYLKPRTSAAQANRRLTLAAGETVSFEFGTKAVELSAESSGVPFRLWVLG